LFIILGYCETVVKWEVLTDIRQYLKSVFLRVSGLTVEYEVLTESGETLEWKVLRDSEQTLGCEVLRDSGELYSVRY